jgi:hypothetical protein
MAILATFSIPYPIPGQKLRVTMTPTGGGNHVKVYATNGPVGSKLQEAIDQAESGRLLIHECGTSEVWVTDFDRPGIYLLQFDEFIKGASSYGGGYAGAPDSFPSETRIGSSSISMSIGRRMACRVGTSKDSAELALHIWGTYVRATTLSIHGEATPSLAGPSTPRAANAIVVSDVTTALAALAGQLATTIAGSPTTVFNNIAAKFNAHLSHAGHAHSDGDNSLAASYLSPTSPDRLSESLAKLKELLDRHCRNDSGAGTGSAASIYHSTADWINLPIADPPSDTAGNALALADCWRAYDAHRAQVGGVHSSADGTNFCTALPALLNLHRLIFAELAKETPTAASTEHSGAMTLTTLMGLK